MAWLSALSHVGGWGGCPLLSGPFLPPHQQKTGAASGGCWAQLLPTAPTQAVVGSSFAQFDFPLTFHSRIRGALVGDRACHMHAQLPLCWTDLKFSQNLKGKLVTAASPVFMT